MARTWMIEGKKGDPIYDAGIAEFYAFVGENVKDKANMACPCDMCLNIRYMSFSEVKIHLEKNSFSPMYRQWIFHGESKNTDSMKDNVVVHYSEIESDPCLVSDDDVSGEANLVYGSGDDCDHALGNNALESDHDENIKDDRSVEGDFGDINVDDDECDLGDINVVLEKLRDCETPLYESCGKYTKLSAVVKLYNLKAANGWSDKSFTDLLELLKDMFPADNVLPNRTYEAKKILRGIGMKYEKIHACPNDCILYRKEFENLSYCPKCNTWRYKKKEGIPSKVLWYFPILPKFRQIFANKEYAKLLTWHNFGRPNDGKLRHPADGKDWKFIDEKYPDFGKEPRNLRLALSTDGMNPFGNLSSQHSTWPVILAIYNLPTYLCMKRKYLMLSLLISGPKEPGNDIDVYLAPLLDDLRGRFVSGTVLFSLPLAR